MVERGDFTKKIDNPGNSEVYIRGLEFRFAEIDKDVEELARLFAQSSTLPHLSGMAPYKLPENEKYYYDGNLNRYPLNTSVMVADPDEVRNFYEAGKSDLVPIVAEDPRNKGRLLGSVTVIKPSGGLLYGVVSKLVVDEVDRGRNLGTFLVKVANKYIFDNGYWQSYAGIIVDVPGEEGPRKIFAREGFEAREPIEPNRCISWDSNVGIFKVREVLLVVLQRDRYGTLNRQ